jgi:hypothetical protein
MKEGIRGRTGKMKEMIEKEGQLDARWGIGYALELSPLARAHLPGLSVAA